MDMPTSLSDFVLTRHADQMRVLEAYVEGKLSFPSPHTNSILLHGQYGSGKTLLASILPVLIEYSRAVSDTKQDYDFRYQYMDRDFSVTPQNSQKQPLFADTKFVACGGESAGQKQKIVSQVKEIQRLSYDWSVYSYRYFIFDEVDEWNSAQSDLKSLVSNAGPNSIFIFTTNFLQKVDKGLQSRCIKFEMNKNSASDLVPLVKNYYPFTKSISDDRLERVIQEANADWREIKRLIQEVRLTSLNQA
jgi:DNA polymerase III delta prime subunit